MRQVAKHVWIKELLDGDYEVREGWNPNVLHCARGEVTRCNVIGTILSLNDQLHLDDGTGQVLLRAFDEVPGLKDLKSGMMVQVVGRPRKYHEQFYLIPEIITPVEPGWALVRKDELGEVQNYTPAERPEPAPATAPEPENKAEQLVALISELDDGEGVDVDEVIKKSGLGEVAEGIVNQLLLDGEVFEVKPGVVKVL